MLNPCQDSPPASKGYSSWTGARQVHVSRPIPMPLESQRRPVLKRPVKHPRIRPRDWWKILRVFGYLAIRPQDITRYFRWGGFAKETPLELGMPWWSFGAVNYLESKLKPDFEVFEFGSGGSTIFVGARVRSVTCVEDDLAWTTLVSNAAGKNHLGGVTVLHRPFDFWKTDSFGGSDYLLSLSGRAYDVIIVDGKEWSDQVRDLCFWRAEDHIKPGGIIVLDDSWRYPQVKRRNKARRWKEFKGVGFCRSGVTSTSIFEY